MALWQLHKTAKLPWGARIKFSSRTIQGTARALVTHKFTVSNLTEGSSVDGSTSVAYRPPEVLSNLWNAASGGRFRFDAWNNMTGLGDNAYEITVIEIQEPQKGDVVLLRVGTEMAILRYTGWRWQTIHAGYHSEELLRCGGLRCDLLVSETTGELYMRVHEKRNGRMQPVLAFTTSKNDSLTKCDGFPVDVTHILDFIGGNTNLYRLLALAHAAIAGRVAGLERRATEAEGERDTFREQVEKNEAAFHGLRAELAAEASEIQRLRGVIREGADALFATKGTVRSRRKDGFVHAPSIQAIRENLEAAIAAKRNARGHLVAAPPVPETAADAVGAVVEGGIAAPA